MHFFEKLTEDPGNGPSPPPKVAIGKLFPGGHSAAMSTMTEASASPNLRVARPRALSRWLFIVAAMIFVMVVVGGITRLTESGLSMTRWEPVSGTVPPLNAEQWQREFDSYRATPEYQKVNRGMTLSEFKGIFFWEYVHRLLGRLIGVAFALPLAWFAWRRAIPAGYGWRLTGLLALGGLQGAIGWWMVSSGLVDRPDVSHIRLAIHLLVALLILACIVWTAFDLAQTARNPDVRRAAMPTIAIWALSLLALQLMFGAYVAGLNAGYAFNTWPKMGDEWFPAGTPMLTPWLSNLVDNPIVVQFVHRWLAFAVAAAASLLAWQSWRKRLRVQAYALVLALLVQMLLGIATIRSGVEIVRAVSHQANAVVLLVAMLWTAHALGTRKRVAST
jgi:cytochrome c oxidase assembly protein subunit 15